jgi:hypothetical protein
MANSAFDHSPTITVPGSSGSTNDAVVRWDGTGGLTFQNSVLVVTDAGAISGATQISIDNIRIYDNSIISTNSNGAISITPNGTGSVAISKADINGGTIDATTIGVSTASTIAGTTITAATSVTTPILLLSGSSNSLTLDVGNSVAAYTVILPDAAPTADDKILKTSGGSPYSQLVWGDAAGGTTINSNADNRIITGSGSAGTLEGEQYLTFSGNNMVLQSTSGGSGQSSLYIETYKSTASGWHGGQLVLRLSMNNTIGSHTVVQADHTLGNIDFEGSDGSAFYRSARIITEAGQNWSGSAKGSRMKFFTTSNGATSFTERMRIETDGDVNVKSGNLVIGTAGKGIDFSANANVSASGTASTSELLDWYEEGTFTPTMKGQSADGTITYVSNLGRFTRIGNRVYIQLWVDINASSGASGQAMIYGLPYTVVNVADALQSVAIGRSNGLSMAGANQTLGGVINRNTSHIELRSWDTTDGMSDFPIGEFGTGAIAISGFYEV